MRRIRLALCISLGTLCAGTPTHADCLLIERLDVLHSIQARLAQDPNTALFATDIRQLRALRQGIADRDMLTAVEGNGFVGRGADFRRFLQNTQDLLQRASLDDPQSVRPHFTMAVRTNLGYISAHLTELRCNTEEIAVATQERAERGSRSINSDADDLAQVAANVNALAQEIFRWRTLGILVAASATTAVLMPILRRWRILRRRRAKRHNTTYETHYLHENREIPGMLIDINCHGTKLRHEADNPLPQGASIEIAVAGHQVPGTVMWSNTHYSGVQFRNKISLRDVATVCAESGSKQP